MHLASGREYHIKSNPPRSFAINGMSDLLDDETGEPLVKVFDLIKCYFVVFIVAYSCF